MNILVLGVLAMTQPDLSEYFGFDDQRVVVVDQGCGPLEVGDFNGDGRPDLCVVNNRKSRLELHLLRGSRRTVEEMERDHEVNELPPNPWYDRVDVSVRHRVGAVASTDADGDGLADLVYTGFSPEEIVLLRQTGPGVFEPASSQRVRDMYATELALLDVTGDDTPEVLTLRDGRLVMLALDDGVLGEPEIIGAGTSLEELSVGDFNGDGRADVMAMAPETSTPLRLMLHEGKGLGAELRFESADLVDACVVPFSGRDADSIAAIEGTSRRIVLADLSTTTGGDLVTPRVIAFADDAPDRSVAIGDVDGDGHPDLLTTASTQNAIEMHASGTGGLGAPELFASFKEPDGIALGDVDGDGGPEIFVMSREEGTVGVARFENGRMTFPAPLTIATSGGVPEAMQVFRQDGRTIAAIVVKQRRDMFLELHTMDDEKPRVFELEDINRAPKSIIAGDVTGDGRDDLLLLTPNQPLIMIANDEVVTSDDMPNFGLVQAAGPSNTSLVDSDGDGRLEFCVAHQNFVCALRYEDGWVVTDQINLRRTGTSLVALAVQDRALVAMDVGNERLVRVERDGQGIWRESRSVRVPGFVPAEIHAGVFGGILGVASDSFAVMSLEGEGMTLDEVAVHRSESESRFEHFITSGDVNGDGYTDLVVLDAREQMCTILTCSSSRRLLHATEFKV
ncbi:MAG: VCBS repeat-containing protein, partial [Phycisphaerales bacterium]|nr:VCBS repeat-containing protein [Phycisphaerales bacterium]